jgi:hypothetical protein
MRHGQAIGLIAHQAMLVCRQSRQIRLGRHLDQSYCHRHIPLNARIVVHPGLGGLTYIDIL